MQNFADIEGMCGLLRVVRKELPGDAGREEFIRRLREQFGFTPQQMEIYAATLLSRNSEESPDNAKTNAETLLGTWQRSDQTGSSSGWMKTITEKWVFRDNLTYEYSFESYAAAVTSGPFLQSSYSSPTSNVDRGIWAPSDVVQPGSVTVAIISFTAAPKRLTCRWAGADGQIQTKISIHGSVFVWQ